MWLMPWTGAGKVPCQLGTLAHLWAFTHLRQKGVRGEAAQAGRRAQRSQRLRILHYEGCLAA